MRALHFVCDPSLTNIYSCVFLRIRCEGCEQCFASLNRPFSINLKLIARWWWQHWRKGTFSNSDSASSTRFCPKPTSNSENWSGWQTGKRICIVVIGCRSRRFFGSLSCAITSSCDIFALVLPKCCPRETFETSSLLLSQNNGWV